jgi:precorrin-2 dehydrogenase/sirohydrochlorin ferrochelatase
MIAVALNAAALPIAVAGRGSAVLPRFLALQAGGARNLLVFADQPSQDLRRAAGPALREYLPDRAKLAGLRLLWIVELPDDITQRLVSQAQAERVLVNVEDQPALCEFHNVAEVRRGDLLLTVSTGGASPRLAASIRAWLDARFGPEWAVRLDLLRVRRAGWRRSGEDAATLTDALLKTKGWLQDDPYLRAGNRLAGWRGAR